MHIKKCLVILKGTLRIHGKHISYIVNIGIYVYSSFLWNIILMEDITIILKNCGADKVNTAMFFYHIGKVRT